MEVRPGYKVTDVGVIPEQWEVSALESVAKIIDPQPDHRTPREAVGGDPYIGISDFTDDLTVDWDASRKIVATAVDKQQSRFRMSPGDIIFGKIGTIGSPKFLPAAPFRYGLSANVLLIQPAIEPHFLMSWFRSTTCQRAITGELHSTSQAAFGIHKMRRMLIPVPPKSEQKAIAEALSDVDALLGRLVRLIAKTRDLKQAAMQQLLTGQTRLPGFHGEWERKRLRDVGEISSAGVDKKIRPDEVPVRLVNYLDVYRKDFIYSKDLNHCVTAPPQQAKRCAVLKGDVFFTPTSETRDDIGISAVAMEDIPDAAYSYHVVRLRLYEPWDLRFRTYAFKTREFLDQAETLCDGNGTRYVISQGKFRNIAVRVPPLPEQTAIAAVLSAMDAELAALKARGDKTRALHQAMMHELLTGKTRLVAVGAVHA